MDEFLTVDEVASYLRVSRATVWRWCQDKKVPAFKIGREWRISAPTLNMLLKQQQMGHTFTEDSDPPPVDAGP
jgi:excisionase family DNA binding protein